MTTAILITLVEAKAHLRLTTPPGDPGDPDLQLKLDLAEDIILDYLNLTLGMRTTTAGWTAATIPAPAKAAILLELGELYRFRGDDPADSSSTPSREVASDQSLPDLAPMIVGLLRRTQPLVIA